MPDYSKAKIYRLVCNITGKQYIGSTCLNLGQRKAKHIYDAKQCKKYVRSKDIINGGDFSIILIEKFPCQNIEELKQRERHFIETMECVNKAVPLRTKKEYYFDNKDKFVEQKKHYYQQNADEIKKRSREYRQENKETISQQRNTKLQCQCGGRYTVANKSAHLKTRLHQDYLNRNKDAP